MKILMVCLGNICRSPLAEGILRHKAENAGLDWVVHSSGTSGFHIGEPPHLLSQKVARANGIDISGQQCSQFRKEDLRFYDKIYVMDRSNYADLNRLCGTDWIPEKVALILNELYPGEDREVPDPWYGGEAGYHEVFNMLEKACEKIIEKSK
ncbi:MAG TPA: low molecular weight protein-tyrosine-phosphatase [Sediminibacterium sp.]|nr:low molecular weight protein-tyrosine-phosphatase [Sediminibacterium sp.]